MYLIEVGDLLILLHNNANSYSAGHFNCLKISIPIMTYCCMMNDFSWQKQLVTLVSEVSE